MSFLFIRPKLWSIFFLLICSSYFVFIILLKIHFLSHYGSDVFSTFHNKLAVNFFVSFRRTLSKTGFITQYLKIKLRYSYTSTDFCFRFPYTFIYRVIYTYLKHNRRWSIIQILHFSIYWQLHMKFSFL